MFLNWLRSQVRRKPRPLSSGRRSRSFQPSLLQLEDRLAPANVATLTLTQDILVLTGTTANNNITITTSGDFIQITDSAGEFGTVPAGFTGKGTNTVTGQLPATLKSITINTGGGFDTVTFSEGCLTTGASLSVNSEVINVLGSITSGAITFTTGTGGVINLGGGSSMNSGANVNAGNIALNGNVNVMDGQPGAALFTDGVVDGNVTISGNLTGSGSLYVNPDGLTGNTNTGGNVTVSGMIGLSGAFAIGAFDECGGPGANNVYLNKSVHATEGITVVAANAIRVSGSVSSNEDILFWANADATGAESFIHTAGDIATNGYTVIIAVNGLPLMGNIGGGTGNATVRGITTAPGGGIAIIVGDPICGGGGAIIDGNGVGVLNANTGYEGGVVAIAGGAISLDTATSYLTANSFPAAGKTGDIQIRNTGHDLIVGAGDYIISDGIVATNGSVTITNGENLSVYIGSDVWASNTVTITTGGNGTRGSIYWGTDSCIGGGGTIYANKVVLTVADSIGDEIDYLQLETNFLTATTKHANPQDGEGINIVNFGSLTVLGAIAAEDDVDIVAPYGSLTVTGKVMAENTVYLWSGGPLTIASGSVLAENDIYLYSDQSVTVARNTTVAADDDVEIGVDVWDSDVATASVTIAGTVTGQDDVAIQVWQNFDGCYSDDLEANIVINGTVLAAEGLLLGSYVDGDTTINISGKLTAGGGEFDGGDDLGVYIEAYRLKNLIVGGSITTQSEDIEVDVGGDVDALINVTGTLNSADDIRIYGNDGYGTTSINLYGTAKAVDEFEIDAYWSDGLTLNQAGTLTAGEVEIIGSAFGPNFINLSGNVTANNGNIIIDLEGDPCYSSYDNTVFITGKMSAVGTTVVIGSTEGDDMFHVAPSTTSTFTFVFGTGNNTLFIAAPFTQILSANVNFLSDITFKPTSNLKSWTRLSGNVTVTPSTGGI